MANIGFVIANELLSKGVEFREIVGSEKEVFFPIKAEPFYIILDGVNVFGVFGDWIGVIKAKVALTLGIFISNTKIEANGFGVANVKVPIGLGRKPSGDVALMFVGGQIIGHNRADKIETLIVVGVSWGVVTHRVHLVKFYDEGRLAPPRHLINRRWE